MSPTEIARLLKEMEPRIQLIAKQCVRSGVELDDLLQEGRMAVLRAAQTFDDKRGVPFSTLADCCARNAMRKYVAKENTQMHGAPTAHTSSAKGVREVPYDETPEDVLNAKQRRRLFVVAVMELSEDERDLLARRFDEEKGYREIAADLEIGVGPAHAAVKRAIENLISKLRAA